MDLEPKPRANADTLPDNRFFRVPTIALRFIGVWPMDPGRLPIYGYINICLLTFSCIGGAWFTFIHITNIQISFDALCPTSTETLSLFKILGLAYYRNEFRSLLKSLYHFYKSGRHPLLFDICSMSEWWQYNFYYAEHRPDCMDIYRKETYYGHIVSTVLLTLSLSTDVTYILRPIATNIYRYFIGQPLVRELPFQAAWVWHILPQLSPLIYGPFHSYPFDVYHENYFIIYAVVTQGGNCTGSAIGGIDSLFLIFCLHLSAQYSILKYEIDNLIAIEICNIHIYYLTKAYLSLTKFIFCSSNRSESSIFRCWK